jgi:hypothetical protein
MKNFEFSNGPGPNANHRGSTLKVMYFLNRAGGGQTDGNSGVHLSQLKMGHPSDELDPPV